MNSLMVKLESHENKVVGFENAEKALLERRLQETDVRVKRSASVEEGEKACYNHDDQLLPTEIPGNYTVFGGAGLVLFDVDIPKEDLPEWIRDLPSTFVVESPHGGYHVYYIVEDDSGISNRDGVPWGSIRYEGKYVVGPGSAIDHGECNSGKTNCPGKGIGEYEIKVNKPIATLSDEHLEHLREACESSGGDNTSKEDYGGEKITLPEDTLAHEGERYICTEFTRHSTQLAGADLMDLLRGGTGSYGLRRDNNPEKIDQSAADYYALELLYGAFLFRGEKREDARKLAISVFKRYCRENPYDKTGNTRKWLRRGEGYLLEQMDAVQQGFDRDKWNRWRRREHEDGYSAEEHTPWADPAKDGTPSLITQDTVRAALQILTSDFDPEYVARQYGLSLPPTNCGEMFTPRGSISSCDSFKYPVAREVGKVAAELNPERKASYFAETVKKLSRETDEVAHAYCPSRPNGERHVYYLSTFPDPEDARWVKVEGVPKDECEGKAPKKEVLTDGGTTMNETESQNKLERTQSAESGGQKESERPEVLTCPQCDQSMLSEDSLRNHVSQSRDDDHRGLTLDDSLEPVEKHKVEEILREQYVEQEKTLQELEEEWGTSRGTIHYWLKQFDIERRPHVATRVQRTSFGLDNSGYERAQSRIPGTRKNNAVQIHQLVAIADGADPEKIFSGGKYQCHHRNRIPWDNRPENVQLLTREKHQHVHRLDEWTENDGFPVLLTQPVQSEAEYHDGWGPGIRGSDSDECESVYEKGDVWGPGTPNNEA
jgi:hypothetical protein